MTEQEWRDWVEQCISKAQKRMKELEDAEKTESGLMQYKLSVARRMMNFWFGYQAGRLTPQDFYSSLRSYLLVWNTDILLPHFQLMDGEPFGLMQDPSTGRIFANYHTPAYLNKHFLKDAYMQNVSDKPTKKGNYDLDTPPFVYHLTGFSRYKSMEQKLAVSGALKSPDGYTTLIAMLTGGGKSLVTQTVAYQKESGLTLVILPTISLMLDQERNAKAIIHSNTEQEIFCYYSGQVLESFLSALKQGKARMLFVSPEALIRNRQLREALLQANKNQYIKNLIIDEAHIVVEWGAAFRVDYQCLDAFQRELLRENPDLRTFLMSATYSKDTVKQLRHFYTLEDRWIEIRCDRLRREPRYCIIKSTGYTDRLRKLEELAAVLPRPMIIYVNAPDAAQRVQEHLKKIGIRNTHTFTGETPNKERERLIEQWAKQSFDIMIATCAFGVGVDKKDVRTVLHLYVPENPNKYYQEAGRGGRDGLPCLSIVLYTEEDTDKAFKRMQKVLTTDKLSGRWFSMLQSKKTIRKVGELLMDTSVKPSYNDTDGFLNDVSDIDISWNVYVLLLLRRNYLIEILDVIYEDGRYLFKIHICNPVINKLSDESIALFDKIRTDEWDDIYSEFEMMRKSLRRAGTKCWSEMFNEVYHLTEAFCSGCNAHDDVINEESGQFPLLQKLPVIATESSPAVQDIMEYAEKMLVLTGEEHIKLVQFMVNAGIGCVVNSPENELSEVMKNCENVRSTCMMMYEKEFLEFCSRAQYYLTGSILIVLPEDEYMIQRLLDAAYKLCRDCQVKVVFVSKEDTFLAKRGKRLSELIEGPCKQSYLILKGENHVSE